ncbi:putative leucine-rich repeat-containing protein DDB_G0290503 [Prorops nasuta]|uniref:putative leucine-rich repeat-containing protein DDB_G0290503 n=1 Tax=Prorops nasuta TaxID=863751 RepID=UPI0034CD5905
MDVQTGLVYVGVVIFSAAVILLVSMFGIKEKSYEEAIAEQRKLPDDLLFSKKDKNKEKKHKNKAGKKVKEKKEEKDEKDEKSEHVQFEETPQILPPEPPVQEVSKGNKKKGKLDKVKPILVNKDEALMSMKELDPSQPLSAEVNHFEIIHPKDDLELIRSQSRENLHLNSSEPANNKFLKETPTKSKRNLKEKGQRKDDNSKDEKKEVLSHTSLPSSSKDIAKEVKEQPKDILVREVKETVRETIIPSQSSNKESKKTKKRNDILTQIGGDKDGVDISLLVLLIQKAELSRSEIQILIDQLFNKQLDNPLEHSEWTEGRADPVIKLKKQLAEKEKALIDEHEASVAFQSKLKELRTELNSERSRLTASIRHLEEALNAKVTEAQTSHTRMQHILESHAAEKQGFARQIEQLQGKVNEDAAIIHKMQEEQGQTQGHMQQELIAQRKQMEIQFSQMRENENALKTQLAQKHVEVQELQNELQATCNSSTNEIDMLRQQLAMMQGQLMHSEGQLQHFKEAGDRLQDVARQLEESHRAHADMDHRLKNAHRHEQELQKQITALQVELSVSKTDATETSLLKNELNKTQSELNKLKSELSATKNEAKSEAAEISTLIAALNSKEEDLKKTRDELTNVLSELTKSSQEVNQLESKLNNKTGESEIIRIELEKALSNLKQSEEESSRSLTKIQRLQDELKQIQSDLSKANIHINSLNKTISEITHLQDDMKLGDVQLQITRLEEENDRLKTQLAHGFGDAEKRLHEENELLASQLAALTERPAAEGKENGIEEKVQKNNAQLLEHVNLLAQKDNQLDALKVELSHKETELTQLNAQIETLRSDVNNQHSISRRLQDDLEAQKSKNNELRTKNWKVMEALSAAESRNKTNSGINIDDVAQKVKLEEQELTKAFLQRIFPEIKVSEKSHEKWISAFENRIRDILTELKEKNITSVSNSDLEKQNKSLQGMVAHYKQIIDDTEGMLKKLQCHIESEESRWQTQLHQKENEATNLRIELNELRKKISVEDKKIQQKITDLESRLTNAESLNRELVATKNSNKSVSRDLTSWEKLQEEKSRPSQSSQNQGNEESNVDTAVAKLRSLAETSESSLAQEKNLVIQLQQEISQFKNEVGGGCSSSEQPIINGPPASDSLKSEIEADTLIAALENTLLKNTELDNDPLLTKFSSKSCQMTKNNSQNPLNGQQHKKHKKKRKSTKNSMAKRPKFAGWFRKKITPKNKLC